MQRLVVLNRSRMLESWVNDAWVVDSVKPDAGIKSGVYRLHAAEPAELERPVQYEGVFIHSGKGKVYQALDNGKVVVFEDYAFRDRPVIGQRAVVTMNYGLADVAEARKPSLSKSRGLSQLLLLVAIVPILAFPDLSYARGLLDAFRAGAGSEVYTSAQMREGFTGCANLFPGNTPISVSMIEARWKPQALCSNQFAVLHSGLTKTPLMVVERLNARVIADARDEERTDEFFPDPRLGHGNRAELDDFRGSGYDRGHLAPAADMRDTQAMSQSFALSNMVPQDPTNNRKIWSKIESDVRKFARRARGDVFVYSGPIFGVGHETIGSSRVWVPTHLFKLVYDQAGGRAWAYILENSPKARINPPIGYDEFVRQTGWQPLGAAQMESVSQRTQGQREQALAF